jgi:hypothetical protein
MHQLPLLPFVHSQLLVELIVKVGEVGQDSVGYRLAKLPSSLRDRERSDSHAASLKSPTKIGLGGSPK